MRYRGAIFGWYHQRNAGDDRFAYCFERWLHDHDLTFLPHTQSPPLDVLERCDYVILGGGNIANEAHGVFSGMQQWIRAANIPVFAVGLSISHHPELHEELRALPESGGRLWLRDPRSAGFLDFEQAFLAPDIAWLYPRTFAWPLEREIGLIGVNFRPWEKRKWDVKAWAEIFNQVEGQPVPWPLCFGQDSDEKTLREILPQQACPAEYDATMPQRAELIVAMRFHAIIFAIQAGTPFVAIGNTRKVTYLLEQLGLEKACVELEEPENFIKTLDWVQNNVTHEKLLEISQSQSAKAWQVADKMKAQIEVASDLKREKSSNLSRRLRRRLRALAK